MTFDEYIQNPMGVKNAVFSHREMYRTLYKNKFDKILMREAGKIDYKLFRSSSNFYVYFKIPSEVIENFYYDVVIQFIPDNEFGYNDNSLTKYDVKFFSNDPSFVFTFAHAMKTNNMFIADLSSKMSKEALTTLAKERNPSNQPGYVKSIYFAYLAMKTYNLFDKRKFTSEGNLYNKTILTAMIMHADDKIARRQEAAVEKNKKKKRDTERKTPMPKNNLDAKDMVKRVKNTMFTKSTSKIGSSKKIGRVKKI